MKVYTVESVECDDYNRDFQLLNIASSLEKAINFIERCLDDPNSGVGNDTLIQITEETVDGYFENTQIINRISAKDWMDYEL